MKILQFCKKFPIPSLDGETIAIHNITTSFSSLGHETTVFAINTVKHFSDLAKLSPDALRHATYEAVTLDTPVKPIPAFINLFFTKKSYNIERFYSKSVEDKLIELLKKDKYDVIHLEGIYLATYLPAIRKYSNALVAMRTHNVEHEIWERLALETKNPLKRWYMNVLSKRMKRFELGCLNEFDVIIPITSKDAQFWKAHGCNKPMHVSPTGINPDKYTPNPAQMEFPSIYYLGALDWLPNQEGIGWFLREIWPSLVANHPDWRFYIAGRNMPESFNSIKQQGVTVVGEVPDAATFANSKAVSIVPLHSGSGMRIKIVEAMALGKAIVTTSVGVEGIDAISGEHLFIANTPDEFAAAISKCLSDRRFIEEMGQKARTFVLNHFNQQQIGASLIGFYANHIQQ